MQQLAESFSDQWSGLKKQWEQTDKVSTESLRPALQRYRSFFERMLAINADAVIWGGVHHHVYSTALDVNHGASGLDSFVASAASVQRAVSSSDILPAGARRASL